MIFSADVPLNFDVAPPQDTNPDLQPKKKKVKIHDDKGRHRDKRSVVKRLESGGRILSLIRKAELKKVAKRKIITFLKKKGVSENKIIKAYGAYYKQEGLYEITFNQRPLGFSVIMDTRGKNAIVSSIQSDNNSQSGMKVASRVYEINGKRVDDLKHKEILKYMGHQTLPFYVVFKESKKKNVKLQKKREKIEKGLQWQQEENKDEAESESESDSDTIESYDSDDDEAHVAHHYNRKHEAAKKHKKKKKPKDTSSSLFKPHEIDQWDDSQLEDEQAAMLKHLSRLMMGTVVAAEQTMMGQASPQGSSGSNLMEIDGMTHIRQNTLKTLLDVTQNEEKGHQLKKSMSTRDRKFSVSDLTANEEEHEADAFDPEIFKYLSELVGEEQKMAPLTPSTSKLMKDLFNDNDVDEDEDVSLNLPDFGSTPKTEDNPAELQSYPSTNSDFGSGIYSAEDAQMNGMMQQQVQMPGAEAIDDEDVIESLEQGTTLLKYGKYGKPKYKMFHLTPDHKYLVWYSLKKNSEETRIRIKEIRKIAIGSDSKVVEKTKKTDLHETSFTIYYGKSINEKNWKSLTVSAKNTKEAFVWAQGLKILSDASKQGKHLRTLSKAAINHSNKNNNEKNAKAQRGHHGKTQSVIISMDKLQKQSVLNLFSKSQESTAASLLKQHSKHKVQLKKCVDFVMAKPNYRAISNAGQFDKVRGKLEDLDLRLRDIKSKLTANNNDDQKKSDSLSSVKAELFLCAAELDALKQKLTAIVARPQKL